MVADLSMDRTYSDGAPEVLRWQLFRSEPYGWEYGDGIGTWHDSEDGDGRGEEQ